MSTSTLASPPKPEKLHALLAHDSRTIARLLTRMCEMLGASVTHVSTRGEFSEQVRNTVREVDRAFDYKLGVRGHEEVAVFAVDQFDRCAAQSLGKAASDSSR